MTTKIAPDGQTRKTLADQIDQLENLLDGLADHLNAAVSTAVEAAVGQAVRQAVEGALTELIQHPAVRDLLIRAAAPAPAPSAEEGQAAARPASPWQAVCGRVRATLGACGDGLGRALQAARRAVRLAAARTWCVALAAAGTVAGAAYLARDKIAAAASAAGGWARGLAAHAAGALGRWLPALAPCRG